MITDNEIGTAIVDVALKVHRALGPGLLEGCYEACLSYELTSRGYSVERQVEMPVFYEGIKINVGFRADIIVNNRVVIELKAVEKILDLHQAQLLTYMKLGGFNLGYLINFNVKLIKDGIMRRVL